jgi:hypothetical protein
MIMVDEVVQFNIIHQHDSFKGYMIIMLFKVIFNLNHLHSPYLNNFIFYNIIYNIKSKNHSRLTSFNNTSLIILYNIL